MARPQHLHQQPTTTLDVPIEPLDESNEWKDVIKFERALIEKIRENCIDPKKDVDNENLLPCELISNKMVATKSDGNLKLNSIKMAITEVEDEEEADDEEDQEDEDEEQVVEDEEEDAGGDYIVSHFDNGEGFEENDTEDDDMADR